MAQSYLATLLLYYEEEIEGDAYFTRLAQRMTDPRHRHVMDLLARVERHAAIGVAPLIAKYNLTPRSTAVLTASGYAQADAASPIWAEQMAEMNATYPGYLADFRSLELLGPAADQPALQFLTKHEIAAIAFLSGEGRGGQTTGETTGQTTAQTTGETAPEQALVDYLNVALPDISELSSAQMVAGNFGNGGEQL
jgi:hypothetical protein